MHEDRIIIDIFYHVLMTSSDPREVVVPEDLSGYRISCRPGTQRHCSTCSCSFVLEEGDELTKIREEVGNGTGIVRLALYTSCPNCHASLFVAGKEVSSAATHVA